MRRRACLLALAGFAAGMVACGGNSGAPSGGVAPAPSSVAVVGSPAAPVAAQASPAASATGGATTATSIATPAASPRTGTPAAAAQTAPAAATVSPSQPPGDPHGWGFSPATVTVKAGGTVTWTNPAGNEIHTVTADDGKAFDSGVLSPGDAFQHRFTAAGSVPYHCTLHPWMKGTVQVTP